MSSIQIKSDISMMLTQEELLKFLDYKEQKSFLTENEKESIAKYIRNETYIKQREAINNEKFPEKIATKKIISKEGTKKKRVVYTYDDEINVTLKFIAYKLHEFDYLFYDNCYSFRKNYGVIDAINNIKKIPKLADKYCLKVDISNYFNSMNIDILLDKLSPVAKVDNRLYKIFENILKQEYVCENGSFIREKHGGMAGIPVSPFFANMYMRDVDRYFQKNEIKYYRYSDDILMFADSYEELIDYKTKLYEMIDKLELEVNKEKEAVILPGNTWEFLGFSYKDGEIDLSDNTIRKLKSKIKRKANALRRWQRQKGLSWDKAAKGFINCMNKKFYGRVNLGHASKSSKTEMEDFADFTWSRWFFPNITTDKSLKIIDEYMQEYIRYCITGRHYKGNYRIKYSDLKELGYRNLVNEYYKANNNQKSTGGNVQ